MKKMIYTDKEVHDIFFGDGQIPKEAIGQSKQWRKERPLATGVLAYFPDALLEVAHTSFIGNEQHNSGQPLHWAREKSTDQLDAALRHITDHLKGNVMDDDGCYHLSKAAWRILAELQLHIEKE
jgi:hypothetical protein